MSEIPVMSCPSGGTFYACGDGSKFTYASTQDTLFDFTPTHSLTDDNTEDAAAVIHVQ